VRGNVDLSSWCDLQDKLVGLINATNNDLVIDCAGLEFIDSTGIAVFMHARALLEVNGRRMRVEHLTGMARRAFDLIGLSEHLESEVLEPT
jgi:anti-anti-sigma factor